MPTPRKLVKGKVENQNLRRIVHPELELTFSLSRSRAPTGRSLRRSIDMEVVCKSTQATAIARCRVDDSPLIVLHQSSLWRPRSGRTRLLPQVEPSHSSFSSRTSSRIRFPRSLPPHRRTSRSSLRFLLGRVKLELNRNYRVLDDRLRGTLCRDRCRAQDQAITHYSSSSLQDSNLSSSPHRNLHAIVRVHGIIILRMFSVARDRLSKKRTNEFEINSNHCISKH